MALTIKHAKHDNIADWTQADLDAQIALGNFPLGTTLADIVLPSDWNNDHTFTGTVPIANGGTGATTSTDAINALLPSQTSNAGKVLTTNGTNTSWQANGSGTVTSVALTAPSVFSVSGSPVTSSGTLALTYSGTALPVTSGGTGQTSFTDGQLLIGNSLTNGLDAATLTAGAGIGITNNHGSILITNTGGSGGGVAGVTASAPLASSGGSTPNISITQAGTSTDGYLSSTDWNTFNNKVSMVYPSAGIPYSTGSAWGTSYTTTGSGTIVALQTNPTLYNPNVDVIDFDTTYSTALTAGQLGWDGNNTLGLGMIGGNVVQHIGEDSFIYCKASSAITKGQVVMFTGAVGASAVPTGAPATGVTDGTYIMGIAAESIALNGFGLVQTFGTLRNVNTTGYVDGDILWYNPSVTGGLTKTIPSAPNVKVQMAAVLNGGSAGGGSILVRVHAGSQLGGTDSNVQITSVVNGQFLTYDGTNAYWRNTTPIAGTGINLSSSSTGVLTVTNSAPDQTVAISGTSPVSVTGTYPNFTVSMTQASTSTNGWLSSIDWNTFNGKQAAYTNLTTIGALANGTGWLYNNGTGTFSYSTPTAADVGAVPTSRTLTVNGTTYDLTANRTWSVGTVTSVSALTIGTTGTDITSSVATGTTTPVITLNIPTASATNRGALSSADWTTFNNKGSGTVTSITSTTLTVGGTSAIPTVNLTSGIATAGTTGSSTLIPVVTIDTYGRVTGITTASNPQGTVTSVAALTLGTTGTDLSSTVATGTTTPVITLNVPTASATNRGALSAADWTTFNNKGNGTVTSVGGTGTVAGITLSGTVTSSGNLTLGGTFALPSGQVTGKMIYDTFTATAGQTSFTTSQTYTSGKVQVSVNGVILVNGTDVTVTSGTAVVMASGLTLNDRVAVTYPI